MGNRPAASSPSAAGYSTYSPPLAADPVIIPTLALPQSGPPKQASIQQAASPPAVSQSSTAPVDTGAMAASEAPKDSTPAPPVPLATKVSAVEKPKPKGLSALPPPPVPIPKASNPAPSAATAPSAASAPAAGTTAVTTGDSAASSSSAAAGGPHRAELMALAARLRELLPSIEAGTDDRAPEVRDVLTSLERLPATVDDLRESQLGLLTQKIKDCPDAQIREIIKRLRKSWKDVLRS